MTVSRCVSALLLLLLTTTAQGEQQCERLKASLSYTQEKAPRDLSGVVRTEQCIVCELNI